MAGGLPFRQAVDASGEVIFMTDRDGIFTFVNREFERLYGYTAAEVVGRATPRLLKSGQTSPETYARLWAQLLRGDVVRAEFTNRTRRGFLVDVEVSISAIREDHDEIAGFLAVQRDVTQQQRADAALQQSEARYRALAENARDAIFILDADNRFEYVNDAAAQSLCRTRSEVIGRRQIGRAHV